MNRFPLPRTRRAIAAVAVLFGAFGVPAVAAPVSLGGLAPLYQGISFQNGTVGDSVGYALRIDLNAPGIGFTTTPRSGPLETTAQTTSQFLATSGTQVAVNANFFSPCCAALPEAKGLTGLAMSNGTVVSPYTAGEFTSSLLIDQDNHALITTIAGPRPDAYNAVTGSSILVRDGVNVAPPPTDSFSAANPRTDVGLSSDGQFLFLVVIDGRQPGYSAGASLQDAADFLIALGAFTGMNLDGGGSSVMVASDGLGGSTELSHPNGGVERYDGNNLGVFALPLPIPEPGTLPLSLVGLFLLTALGVATKRRSR